MFSLAASANTKTTLSNYAYDFTTVGYEITVTGIADTGFSPLSTGGSFQVVDGDYRITTTINGISRKNRRAFNDYFNANCTFDKPCDVRIEGEVEMNSNMTMVLTARKVEFIGSGNDSKVFN